MTASGACIPGPSSSSQTYVAGSAVGAGTIPRLVVGPSTSSAGTSLQSMPSSSTEVCVWPLPPTPSSSSMGRHFQPVPSTPSPSSLETPRPLLPFSTPRSVNVKRKLVPLAPSTPLSRSPDVSPSGPIFTPFRKRPSASESLMRLIESNQMLRMSENEKKLDRLSQQQSMKEQKENLREERKERRRIRFGIILNLSFNNLFYRFK